MRPPPSPVVSTIVDSGRASAAPGTLGKPRPIDWNAVPTMIMRSGEATGQYMFAQPMKWPPSETTTRSSGSSSPMRARDAARVEAAVGRGGVAGLVHAQRPRRRPTRASRTGSRAERGELVDDARARRRRRRPDERRHVRVRRRGGDVDLHHAGARREQLAEAHRELVERGAEHHRDVGLAHELHRALCAEAAGDAEVVAVVGEHAAPERGRQR